MPDELTNADCKVIMAKLDHLGDGQVRIEKSLDRVEACLYGNGGDGLTSRVAKLEVRADANKEAAAAAKTDARTELHDAIDASQGKYVDWRWLAVLVVGIIATIVLQVLLP